MSSPEMTDRVLAILQTRFPREFEIAVLTAQNEILSTKLAEAGDAQDQSETETP